MPQVQVTLANFQYKKGKKLLKEIKRRKPHSPRISSYPSTPRTPHDGHEADTEDGHSGHMPPIYGAIGKPAMRERSSSRHGGENVPLGDGSVPRVSVDPAQQSVSGSEDSTTPIIGYKARDDTQGRRATSIKRGIDAAQVNIRQVIDQLRQRSRKDSDNASFESATTQAELNEQENTFLHWLDDEIKKIDDFYQAKEHDAEERYRVMSAQLEALRNLRNRQRQAEQAKASGVQTHTAQGGNQEQAPQHKDPESQARREGSSTWVAPIRRLRASFDVISSANPGADHERRASSHPDLIPHPIETTTGYVEYRVARRRLKQAMLEFYRGMELLKSYRLMNRTGIQKIMKKFDKTTGRRMSDEIAEKVKSTHFDHSDNLQNVMDRTEDLFARYFEHNNRKNAVERLRSRDKPNEHIPSVFNDGFLLGLAIPFFIEGMVAARDPVKTASMPQAGYLLQVWGGFFLVILFLLLFGINCWVWYHTKINYTFIFEFDTRHHLDHRQYMELPALLLFLGSFFFWLTFQNFWPDSLDGIWYPLIYLCVVVGLFLFPFHTLHRSSRAWFAIANFRILCSGLYPIEFRDFFLGDQYNSLMYSFANFPLFFCLYAKDWDPNSMATCNSSHSRVLGFFTTLPPIWRFLQCLRRFYDTRNVFPHLANAGKYSATILMYVFLSLWRIDDLADYKALFILFAAINTIYCCTFPFEDVSDGSVLGYLYGLVFNATSCSSSFPSLRPRLCLSNRTSPSHKQLINRFTI